jgi:Putative auto-transporter adhesin, head GIN domain
MMKRTIVLAGSAIALLALTACGVVRDAGPPTSQQRPVAGVHAVDLQTSGDLTIRLGDAESLTINAGADAIDNLSSEVVDGTLVLGSKPATWNSGSISYSLSVRSLDGIEVEGSGSVTGDGVLTGQARLTISGSGSVTLSALELTNLTADLSGSGGAVVSGSSASSAVGVSGSGDYDGSALTTARTTVDSSGSGRARVNASESLSVTVSGSGDVTYGGNPGRVDRDVSGSGDVTAG